MELFKFTKDEIFEAVKTESSLFAKRQFTEKGEPLFDDVVFDEEYNEIIPLFRKLFFEAQATILSIIPDSMLTDADSNFISETEEEDFLFYLNIKSEREKRYNPAYLKVITIKIEEALIAYIMYRWLETKMPNFAKIYIERYTIAMAEVRKNLRRTSIGQINPFPY